MTEAVATEQLELVGRYRPYLEYSDSGLSWLGIIPNHWELKRAKFIFQRVQRPVRDMDEIVTAFRDGQVTLRSNRRTEGFTNALQEIGYQGVRKSDLLIHAMDGFAGAIGVSDSDGKCSPVCSVCIPVSNECVEPLYYGYLIRQLAVTGFITSLSKGIRERSTEFRFSEFSPLELALPSICEQRTIAAFLDYETARIDRLIAQQQRLIELLKEKRQAVISHAVTKGINPDAFMKDSGVEWLGQVPEHWGISQPRYLCRFVGGGTPSKDNPEFWDGDLPWVSPKDMKQEFISNSIDRITERAVSASSVNLIPSSAVLMVVRGMILAHSVPVALTTKPVTINQDMKAMIVDNRRLNSVFWLRCLQGLKNRLLDLTESSAHGTKCLRSEDFETLSVPIPPLEEQLRILDYLDSTLDHIDLLLVKATKLICLAEERRTALISAAVTGKIDLRGWTPPAEEVAA